MRRITSENIHFKTVIMRFESSTPRQFMTKTKWPTLEGRLKHPIRTHEEAIEQLKSFKQVREEKVPDQKKVEAFINHLTGD